MFNPPRDVIAARDHMVHVVRSLLQPARVFDRFVVFRLFYSTYLYNLCLRGVYLGSLRRFNGAVQLAKETVIISQLLTPDDFTCQCGNHWVSVPN